LDFRFGGLDDRACKGGSFLWTYQENIDAFTYQVLDIRYLLFHRVLAIGDNQVYLRMLLRLFLHVLVELDTPRLGDRGLGKAENVFFWFGAKALATWQEHSAPAQPIPRIDFTD
jgi:hypothetical protein